MTFSLSSRKTRDSDELNKTKTLQKIKAFYAKKLEELSSSYAKDQNEYERQFNAGILTATLAFLGLFFGLTPSYKSSNFSIAEIILIIATLSSFVLSLLFWLIDYLLISHFYSKKHKHCFKTYNQIESAKTPETINTIIALSLMPMNDYKNCTSPKWAKVTQIVLFVVGIVLCSIFGIVFLLSQ